MFTTDKLIRIEKTGKGYYRAIYAGPNGDATLCCCKGRHETEINAEFIMRTMPRETWQALVMRPNVAAA